MTGFSYQRGILHAEGVPLPRIAEAIGTPVYVYSSGVLTERFERFRRALAGLEATVCYALKANDALAVVRTLAELGAGAPRARPRAPGSARCRRSCAAPRRPHRSPAPRTPRR